MKKRMLTTVCFCLGLLATATAQISVITPDDFKKGEVVDNTLFKVQYKMTNIQDTLSTTKPPLVETMMLEVGKKGSLFYSYSMHVRDSVIAEDFAKGASQDEVMKHAKQFGGSSTTYRIYKNFPLGKVTTIDKLGISKFKCEETNEIPKWKLLPDTMTVLSFLCHKAVCSFKGREYEAWYTLEVPRGEGPWKLSGLPGLILAAKDKTGTYSFECTGIEKTKNNEVITMAAGSNESVDRNSLNKLYERYYKDPVGFIMSTQPGVRVKVTDNMGNATKMQKISYNPIELPVK